jgi:hypothetical protein
MDRTSLGPLTVRQRLFWLLAIAVVVLEAIAVLLMTWPSGACGCGG